MGIRVEFWCPQPPHAISFIFSTGNPGPGTQMIDAPKVAAAYSLLEPYERKLVWELTRDTKGTLDGDLSTLDRSWTVRELGNMVVRMNQKFGARVIDRIPKRGNAGTAYRIKDEYFQLLREYISKDPLFAKAA